MSGGNKNKLLDTQSQFHAQTTINVTNKSVFDEIVYSISKRLFIAASGVIDIVMDPTACTCRKLPLLPISIKFYGAGPIFVDLYINPVYTLGTTIPSGNRDFSSSESSSLIWLLNPTISSPGTLSPFEFSVLSNGVSAVASVGGESKDSQISNIDMTKKYLLRMTNQESNTAHGYMSSTWAEEP